jgi:hypothetical protein
MGQKQGDEEVRKTAHLHVIDPTPVPPPPLSPPGKGELERRPPKNECIYRLIQRVFPDFRWEVREGGMVSFTNYPTAGADPRAPRVGENIPLTELRDHCERVLRGEPSDLQVDSSAVQTETRMRVSQAQRGRRRSRKRRPERRRIHSGWSFAHTS